MLKKLTQNSTYKTGAIFSSASIFSNLITMVIGIIMIRWIEPDKLGIWQSLSVIQLYIPILEAGVPHGLNRELPYLMGRGDKKQAEKLTQTAYSYMVIIALVFFVITILVLTCLIYLKLPTEVIAGAGTVGFIISINAYQRYLTVTFRSSEAFMSLSKVYMYYSGIQLLTFPIVFFYHYYGLLVYSIIVIGSLTLLMHFHRPMRITRRFLRESFKVLSKTGLPVFIMNYLRGISSTFSRLILLSKGGVLSVGLFTPANAIVSLILLLPNALANYLFPKMNYKLGQTNDPKLLWPIVAKVNWLFFLIGIPFAILIWFVTPYIMKHYFYAYSEATNAIQIISISFLFAGTMISHTALYSAKKYKIGYIFLSVEIALRFIIPFIFVSYLRGNILTLMAGAVLVSNAILFFLNLFLLRKALLTGTIEV